ncbi:hypothetical protein M0R72_09335 [Candidatus Pacearchaeota archaeon]|nr:hypothetical protein [Candidatus Pacearchaeota archaeon]
MAHYRYIGQDKQLSGNYAVGEESSNGTLRVHICDAFTQHHKTWLTVPENDWEEVEVVDTLDRLYALAIEKKSVVFLSRGWAGHQGHQPASWVINFNGATLFHLFSTKNICVYYPKPKPTKKKDKGN